MFSVLGKERENLHNIQDSIFGSARDHTNLDDGCGAVGGGRSIFDDRWHW